VINFPGPDKLIMLFVIALIVLGPDKLPDAARTLGRLVGEFRNLTGRFQDEVHGALSDPKDALSSAVGDLRSELGGLHSDIGGLREGISTTLGFGQPADPPASSVPSSAPDAISVSPGIPPLPPTPDDPSLN
jgi:sec-independent protein translocase protein TatB